MNRIERDRIVKLNNIDFIIDSKLLKLDLARNSGLKYSDSIYNSSSPILAGNGHQLFSREIIKTIDYSINVEKMKRSGKSYNTEKVNTILAIYLFRQY
jgi:hypothetical protein